MECTCGVGRKAGVQGFGFRVPGAGFRVAGFGFWGYVRLTMVSE